MQRLKEVTLKTVEKNCNRKTNKNMKTGRQQN